MLTPLRALAALLVACACCHAAVAQPQPPQPSQTLTQAPSQPVGITRVHYEDATRAAWGAPNKPRPLDVTLWYPAPAGTPQAPLTIEIFHMGSSQRDAPIIPSPAKLPLILLSHGTGGSAVSFAWLGNALAAQGYLVAAVNHHGNTGAETDSHLQGFIAWWDRPRDLSVLLDRLLADPRFGPRIDAQRVGVAGFSLGGYTVLAAVGARLDKAQYDRFCQAQPASALCVLPPEARGKAGADTATRLPETDPQLKAAMAHMEDSYTDARFRAAFAIAPVLAPAMTADSLKAIHVPVRLVVGAQDDIAVPEVNARPLARAIPLAQLDVLPGANHYVFLSSCTTTARLFVRPYCADPDGVDRAEAHRQVVGQALRFFSASLGAGR